MRVRSLRLALTALVLVVPAAGSALVSCSSSSTPSASEDSGASDAAQPATDAGDASVSDATLPTDASDASPGDASSDAPDTAVGPTVYDFGIDAGDCGLGPQGEPLDLGCTGLYSNWAAKTVSADLQEYKPGLVFWSDGAEKTRWIALPAGQKIDTSNMDEWTFPVGTRFWKEFKLPLTDGSTATRVETRLLWKLTPTVWYRTTYRWSEDGTTSATELRTGEFDAGPGSYEIPSQAKCNQCHDGRMDGVLGFEAVSLAATGTTGWTLATLTSGGKLTDAPDASYAVPGNTTESAALGWLHSNCGTACHNGGLGLAGNTGFLMRLDVATLASVKATDTYTTGWGQPTIGFPIPGATNSYRLQACDLPESAAYFRASHRDGVGGQPFGTQMPPIDSHLVDTTDVAGLAAWLEEGCDAGAGDAGDGG